MYSSVPVERRLNGRSPSPVGELATAGAVPYDDPMSRVLGLDARTSGLAAWFGFASAGTLLLVGLMALALGVAWWRATHAPTVHDTPEEIEILRDETPPPPPVMEETPPEPAAAPRSPATHDTLPPPPPAPAQAAKVLTQEPRPDEPVDLTGNTIVTGNADAYAGGFTAGNGTSSTAVHGMPSPTGVPGGTGAPQAAPAPPGPDLSRTAALGGGSEWSCPFPPEADTAQVDDAYVTLQVDVRQDGSPTAARVLGDPGNGFGREARRCAMNRRYATALDREGRAIAGTTNVFRVHFSR
jgi:periplasmic protein TonB